MLFAVLGLLVAGKIHAAPLSSSSVNGFSPYGCYSEGVIKYHRAIGKASLVDPAMTVEKCTSFCSAKGYTLAGLEYSNECWCGNKIEFSNSPIAENECDLKCAGNAQQTCGGEDAISVWSSNGHPVISRPSVQITGIPDGCSYIGCHQDNLQLRALSAGVSYAGKMTPAACAAACLAQNYEIAGAEYSWECYCGNYIRYKPVDASQCFIPCDGNDNLICGGEGALSLYHCPRPSPFKYYGCYSDGVIPYHRALEKSGFVDTTAMTIELCTTYCSSKGFILAGLEYGQECWCGNKIEFHNGPIDESKCGMSCVGFDEKKCGGSNAISVWSSNGAPVITHPVPQTTGLPDHCKYVGCHEDNIQDRALSEGASYNGLMTPEVCAKACIAKGFKFAGVEYGYQCYCGNSVKYGPIEESKCFMPCQGNDELTCGGESNIGLYDCTPLF
ncbi:WSC domain-containing protein [Cladochytrium replicatum]|nr:WSC domain-containing protein [Cladochytrium replicatum]